MDKLQSPLVVVSLLSVGGSAKLVAMNETRLRRAMIEPTVSDDGGVYMVAGQGVAWADRN